MSDGSSWSDDAYSITIQLRTPKTVIVEGKSDKSLLERFLYENSISNHEVLVDTADMFSGENYAGLGNRQKVLTFWNSLEGDVIASGIVAILIDREWSELDLSAYPSAPWTEITQIGDFQFQTLGHSIENYGFNPGFVTDYIKHFGSSIYTEKRLGIITDKFPQIIALSASLSISAERAECINKMKGVFSVDDINIGEDLQLKPEFSEKMKGRGILTATEIVNEVNERYFEIKNSLQGNAHLLSHGHLGEDFIWSCIAAIIISDGGDRSISRDLAFGRKDERQRCFFSWLVKLPPADRRPIDSLIELVRPN